MIDIRELTDEVRRVLRSHYDGSSGAYRRWLWQDDRGSRDLRVTACGCADAACIPYPLDELLESPDERHSWIRALYRFQNPSTGLFDDVTHDAIHTTAFCPAALNLFEVRGKYPVEALQGLLLRGELRAVGPGEGARQGEGENDTADRACISL